MPHKTLGKATSMICATLVLGLIGYFGVSLLRSELRTANKVQNNTTKDGLKADTASSETSSASAVDPINTPVASRMPQSPVSKPGVTIVPRPLRSGPNNWVAPPLQVVKILSAGGSYCADGRKKAGLNYAYINTNYGNSGRIDWQIEQRQNGVISVLKAESISITTTYPSYEIKDVRNYSALMTSANSAVRMHVTAPNDIATPWYFEDNSGMNDSLYCGGYMTPAP